MYEKGKTMGRDLKEILKLRGNKLRRFNLHIEDFIDIIDLRNKCFEEADKIFRNETSAKKAYKELSRINMLYLGQFQNRWSEEVLKNFCEMQKIHNVLQRVHC